MGGSLEDVLLHESLDFEAARQNMIQASFGLVSEIKGVLKNNNDERTRSTGEEGKEKAINFGISIWGWLTLLSCFIFATDSLPHAEAESETEAELSPSLIHTSLGGQY